MKAYKIEILVIDHDQLGEDEIKTVIENTRYPNDCIWPTVKGITSKDIGEWSDDHPLNLNSKQDSEYARLFGKCLKVSVHPVIINPLDY